MKNPAVHKSIGAVILFTTVALFGLFSFWAPASSFKTSTVLFVDEGDNFILARKGPLTVLTTYENPNNHVFFTFLQSFLPEKLFYSNPLLFRLNNFIYVIITLLILSYILNRYAKISFLLSVCLAVGLLTISPIQTEWLLFARGYVLGMLLVIGGCILLVKEKNLPLISILFALSFWTIPTYGYILPGIMVARFCRYLQVESLARNLARTMQLGLMTTALTLIFYSPIIKEVIDASKFSWLQGMVYQDYAAFLNAWGEGFSQMAIAKILAGSIVLLLLYCGSQILTRKTADIYWTALMAGSTISYLAVVILLDVLDITNPPFSRNGMFTYTFIWLGVFMSFSLLHRNVRNFLTVVFLVLTLLNLQINFLSSIVQIARKGKPYTVFDYIRDIEPKNIRTILAGPQMYPVILMLTMESHKNHKNKPIKIRKLDWNSEQRANRVFAGECDERGIPAGKDSQLDWKNKALVFPRTGGKILICY